MGVAIVMGLIIRCCTGTLPTPVLTPVERVNYLVLTMPVAAPRALAMAMST